MNRRLESSDNDQGREHETAIDRRRYSFACECGALGQVTYEDYWQAIGEGHQHQLDAHDARVERDWQGRVVRHRGELRWSIDVHTPGGHPSHSTAAEA